MARNKGNTSSAALNTHPSVVLWARASGSFSIRGKTEGKLRWHRSLSGWVSAKGKVREDITSVSFETDEPRAREIGPAPATSSVMRRPAVPLKNSRLVVITSR